MESWDGVTERRQPDNAKKREQGKFILDLLDRHESTRDSRRVKAEQEAEAERQRLGAAELEVAPQPEVAPKEESLLNWN